MPALGNYVWFLPQESETEAEGFEGDRTPGFIHDVSRKRKVETCQRQVRKMDFRGIVGPACAWEADRAPKKKIYINMRLSSPAAPHGFSVGTRTTLSRLG